MFQSSATVFSAQPQLRGRVGVVDCSCSLLVLNDTSKHLSHRPLTQLGQRSTMRSNGVDMPSFATVGGFPRAAFAITPLGDRATARPGCGLPSGHAFTGTTAHSSAHGQTLAETALNGTFDALTLIDCPGGFSELALIPTQPRANH